jgi:hypothetical protein
MRLCETRAADSRSPFFNLPGSWGGVLIEEFEKDYFLKLKNFVDKAYSEGVVYPRRELIFRAFELKFIRFLFKHFNYFFLTRNLIIKIR